MREEDSLDFRVSGLDFRASDAGECVIDAESAFDELLAVGITAIDPDEIEPPSPPKWPQWATRLARAIIWQAVMDAATPAKRTAAETVAEAREWLEAPENEWRALLCEVAGLREENVARIYRHLRANPPSCARALNHVAAALLGGGDSFHSRRVGRRRGGAS
jgi:hypothetical protein